MRVRVNKEKRASVQKYLRYNAATIKAYDFEPGRLVLVRHTKPENTVSGKMEKRYSGPLVVIRRSMGGSYVVAEMNGAVFQEKIAAFRVIPYEARHSIQLPAKLQKFVDVSKEALKALVDGPEPPPFLLKKTRKYKGKDLLGCVFFAFSCTTGFFWCARRDTGIVFFSIPYARMLIVLRVFDLLSFRVIKWRIIGRAYSPLGSVCAVGAVYRLLKLKRKRDTDVSGSDC
ncbi:hypothetical protein K438DRAFT_1631732 [Mycena galopus ATCC 62051]|nr:hypothetical protein K438DRAFT_1631732 [Mycena galopus ATCC 62051]